MGEFVECAEYSRVPGSTQSAREYAEYRGLPRMTRMMRITRRTVDRHGVPQSTADYRDYEDYEDGPDYVDDADHVDYPGFAWTTLDRPGAPRLS